MRRKILYLLCMLGVMAGVFSIASSYSQGKTRSSNQAEQTSSGCEYGYPTNIYTYEAESEENHAEEDDSIIIEKIYTYEAESEENHAEEDNPIVEKIMLK